MKQERPTGMRNVACPRLGQARVTKPPRRPTIACIRRAGSRFLNIELRRAAFFALQLGDEKLIILTVSLVFTVWQTLWRLSPGICRPKFSRFGKRFPR
jgi:hypothetical protein